MYKTYLLFFLFASASLCSQESILLRGEILNDTIEKASLTVVNMNFKKGAITNEAGVFEISARLHGYDSY